MSASIAVPSGVAATPGRTGARPSFAGIVRGELFKISRQRVVWLISLLLACLIGGPYLIYLAGQGVADQLTSAPLQVLYTVMERDLEVLRAFGGIYLLIVTGLVVGQEYQLGTIRILLGRGVGRLQLLGAKVLALVVVALLVLAGALVLDVALACVDLLILAHSFAAFQALTGQFWRDTAWYILSVAISMGATLLLGVAANVVGRSLAFGLGVGLSWFPADNIGVIILALIGRFTNAAFWNDLTAYLLGPILNTLPALIVPAQTITLKGPNGVLTLTKSASTLGITPVVDVTNAHALLVIGGYCLVFAAIAIVLTWRRDVLE